MLLQRLLECLDEEEGGVGDGHGSDDRGRSLRDAPADDEQGAARKAPHLQAGRGVGAHRHDVVAQAQAGSGMTKTYPRGPACGGARLHDHVGCVLPVLQGPRRRSEPAREVVPGPPAAEAGRLERAVVEGVVIADDASGNAPYPQLSQLFRPVQEGLSAAGRVDGGVADAAHDEIAEQRLAADRRGGEQRRFEAVIPAEPLRDGGQGDELHGRRRRQQQVRIVRVQPLVPVEQPDVDAPHQRSDAARREQSIEASAQSGVSPLIRNVRGALLDLDGGAARSLTAGWIRETRAAGGDSDRRLDRATVLG